MIALSLYHLWQAERRRSNIETAEESEAQVFHSVEYLFNEF